MFMEEFAENSPNYNYSETWSKKVELNKNIKEKFG